MVQRPHIYNAFPEVVSIHFCSGSTGRDLDLEFVWWTCTHSTNSSGDLEKWSIRIISGRTYSWTLFQRKEGCKTQDFLIQRRWILILCFSLFSNRIVFTSLLWCNNIGLLWHLLWLVVYNSSSVTRQWRVVTDSAANACYNYPQVPSLKTKHANIHRNIHILNQSKMTDSHVFVASLFRSPVR